MLSRRFFCALLITGMIALAGSVSHAESDGRTIVGSWLGTAAQGNRVIATFNADGTAHTSVQTEISSTDALTPLHGVWEHLPGRQYGVTLVGVIYNINTGQLTGYLKVRVLLSIDAAGDEMIGPDKVQFLDPSGNVVDTFPSVTVSYKRIKFEPFN